jgi:hypothetical protein
VNEIEGKALGLLVEAVAHHMKRAGVGHVHMRCGKIELSISREPSGPPLGLASGRAVTEPAPPANDNEEISAALRGAVAGGLLRSGLAVVR